MNLFNEHYLAGILRFRINFSSIRSSPVLGIMSMSGTMVYSVWHPALAQLWSLTQLYSVDFSQSRINVKKCVFNKRTIKVCVS